MSLQDVAENFWRLTIVEMLPVAESFGSDVLLFDADDGRRYAIKNSFSPSTGQREIDALTALASHTHVPNLIDHQTIDGEMYLLIEGLDGTPWSSIKGTSEEFLKSVGVAIGNVHQVPFGTFDGCTTWHGLLQHNADRYQGNIGADDESLAVHARAALDIHMNEIPDSTDPVLVQFDLRPGNILTKDGDFVALIDFESARGGHPSMDFFKFWHQVQPLIPTVLDTIMAGYTKAHEYKAASSDLDRSWMTPESLHRLMTIYSLYHGLAGLSWCYTRDDFSGNFPGTNRELISSAIRHLGSERT